MSTNASLSIQYPDGTGASIYLHWDGYPAHVLPILMSFYDTQEKVEELISQDLHSLDIQMRANQHL